ncbi:unnamed protein product [Symbiodinium sp. CCMP2592]|nr:unnamed protein product [Symbiodinium sp. CCMP2592]
MPLRSMASSVRSTSTHLSSGWQPSPRCRRVEECVSSISRRRRACWPSARRMRASPA